MRQYDAVIVGGGPAGLNAALMLGRARRQTLVCDSGQPRNAPAEAAHNFLSRDGTPPLQLLQLGRDQLRPYATVEWESIAVESAAHEAGHFHLTLADGRRVASRKLLLATGVRDELPSSPGFREMWGRSVFHCPYCHGWEVRDEPLALYGNGDMGFELSRLLTGWSRDLILCTDGPATLTDAQRAGLATNNIPVREETIARLEGTDGHLEAICFTNGDRLRRRAIFLRPVQYQHSSLPEQLGCTFTPEGLIEVDAMGRTGVSGLYAAGDAAQRMQSVVMAASSGASAAGMLNHELISEEFG
jgi:thioredoxin reductase